MTGLSIIVPLHKFDETYEGMLKKAVESIKADMFDMEIVFVGPKKVIDKVKPLYENARFVTNKGKTDFCSQVNAAVETAKEYFSILESDDVYTETWFKNVLDHIASADREISVYLPLVQVIDITSGDEKPVGYINEAVLASSFSNEMGFIDSECLEDFSSFNLTGAVFKTDDFKEIGKLKPSIKLSFWYEYLLRAAYYHQNMYVIPKVGYLHTINRKDSLSVNYRSEIDQEEADWWMETAKKEYFFKQDREKTYEE